MFKGTHNQIGCLDRPIPQSGSNYPRHSNMLYSQRNITIPHLRRSIRCPGKAKGVALVAEGQ